MAGTLKVGGKVLATHDSGTDEISLDSATNTSNMSFDANHAGIKAALNASGDAPIYACRAWVNFDGSTNTAGFCTIRGSGNVSSITDLNTGHYRVNYTTAMPDANYCVLVTHENVDYGGSSWLMSSLGVTTSSVEVAAYNIDGRAYNDTDVYCIAIFR